MLHYLIHYGTGPAQGDRAGAPGTLAPPARLRKPDERWVPLTLTPREAAAKTRALAAYQSQLLAIGPFLESFEGPGELYAEGDGDRAGADAGAAVRTWRHRASCPPAPEHRWRAQTDGARRLESLDAFRGMAVASMILVNNPGNWSYVYEPLVHSSWNGCTFADLIFPVFIFIVGLSMPFAFAKRAQRGRPIGASLHIRTRRRAAVLVALGLILNLVAAAPALGHVRIPGVLQRIGIVYFVAALIGLNTRPPTRPRIAIGLLLASGRC